MKKLKHVVLAIILLLSIFLLIYCTGTDGVTGASTDNDDDDDTPPSPTATIEPTDDLVVFRATPVSYGGQFADCCGNFGAIWVEDNSGNFITTLDVWGEASRRDRLIYWVERSGWTNGTNIDAVSSATSLRQPYAEHVVTWDMSTQASDGTFKLFMEVTEDNSGGSILVDSSWVPAPDSHYFSITFSRADAPQTLSVIDNAYFKDVELTTY